MNVCGTQRLLRSDVGVPVNIGSEEMISINDLASMVIKLSGKNVSIRNVDGPQGVRGRNSENSLIRELLGWEPTQPLETGMEKTFDWISHQVSRSHNQGGSFAK